MKIDWVKKLTSRKFWIAVVGFVTGVAVMLGSSEEQINNISGTILSAASVVAYIVGEGLADSKTPIDNKGEEE